MKKKFYIIGLLFFLILTIGLGSIFDRLIEDEPVRIKNVYVFPLDKTFILPKEIAKLIPLNGKTYKSIDINEIEKKLEKNNFIQNAEVYKDLNGRLTAKIKQYQPIARVVHNSNSYYLDEKGDKKPLSTHFTENVVLVFGKIQDKEKNNLVELIKTINHDKILKNIVTEIHIKNNLIEVKTDLLAADMLIDLNTDLKKQLIKLKAIYAYLTKKHQTQKYHHIDLRYARQAVCK